MVPYVDIHTHSELGDNLGLRAIRLGIEPLLWGATYSVGIHPWDIANIQNCNELLQVLTECNCAAIGEIGIDRLCSTPIDRQLEIFEKQLSLAIQRSLPVILHSVKAHQIVAEILVKHRVKEAVFHGFIGSKEECERLTKQGYSISFGFGALRSPKTIEAIKACPTERLFLESDTSQESIIALYERVATIKSMDLEQMKQIIHNNYTALFV